MAFGARLDLLCLPRLRLWYASAYLLMRQVTSMFSADLVTPRRAEIKAEIGPREHPTPPDLKNPHGCTPRILRGRGSGHFGG